MDSSTAADRFKPWAMAPPSLARTVALAAAIDEAAAAHPSKVDLPLLTWQVGDLVAVPHQVLERIGQRRPHQGIRFINDPQPPQLATPTSREAPLGVWLSEGHCPSAAPAAERLKQQASGWRTQRRR